MDDVQGDSTTPKLSFLPEHLQPLIDKVSDGLTLQERVRERVSIFSGYRIYFPEIYTES
jgi:hypothetical protein